MSPQGPTFQIHTGWRVHVRGGGGGHIRAPSAPPPSLLGLERRCCEQPPTQRRGDELRQFRNGLKIAFATERLPPPVRARRCTEPKPAAFRSHAQFNYLIQYRESTGLSPSPTSDMKPSCVIYQAGPARQRGNKPPLAPALETPSAQSCQFREFQRATWSTETRVHVWREKPIPLPPRYLHPAQLQVLKFNSLQLGQ